MYFDLIGPFPGWELSTALILRDMGHRVMTVPLHRRPVEFMPQTEEFDIVYVSNAVAAPLGATIAETFNKPLVVQFLDCPLDPALQDFVPEVQAREITGLNEDVQGLQFNIVDKRTWQKEGNLAGRQREWSIIKECAAKAIGTTAISKAAAEMVEMYANIKVQKVNWLGADAEIADESPDQLPKKRIGYVGSNRSHKCVDELLFALTMLDDHPEFLAIVEDLPDDKKWSEMKSCMVGATMSVWEGFGLGPVEWGYVKRPCICRPNTATQEVMGNNAIYVTGITELAAWIRQMIDHPNYAKQKGEQAYDHIIKNGLTLKDHAKRIETYLEELLH